MGEKGWYIAIYIRITLIGFLTFFHSTVALFCVMFVFLSE